MKVHQLALVKWLIRAIIGTLSADGDTTGGSSSTEVATDNPAEEPDHPPCDELKARCAAAWAKFPVKVGTRPFKAKAWEYFYPCEDLSSLEEGDVLEPYAGHVKSIFLPDDQAPLSRKGGIQALTNLLIGKPSTLGNFKPKISPKVPGFRTSLMAEYTQLARTLDADRKVAQVNKRKRTTAKKALCAGATASSNAAFKSMKAAPSDTAKRAQDKKSRALGKMDGFVTKGFASMVNEWSDRITHDQARLFIGSNISDHIANSSLFYQFVKTVLEAGKAGATLPPTDEAEDSKSPHIQLLKSRQPGGSILDDHAKHYYDKVRRKEYDVNCATKTWGFSATSDGTDRMGKGVVNLVLLYKDGTTTFLKLHDSSGKTKDAAYRTQLLVSWFVAEDFPLDPMDLLILIMDGGEGRVSI